MPEEVKAVSRPDIVTELHLTYLDNLKKSGVTNMLGGASYLIGRFALSRRDAATILAYWMDSFEEREASND